MLRYLHLVWLDVLTPRLPEPVLLVTASLNFPLLLLRALSARILPAQLYEQVISPLVVYWCRTTVYLGIILAGPNTAPSMVAQAYLQQSQAVVAYHIIMFASLLGAWDVDARVELAAVLLEAACALTCLSWHGAKVPGGSPHPAALLAGRALVPLVNLSLAYAAGRWRPGGLGTGRRGGGSALALDKCISMRASGAAGGSSSKGKGKGKDMGAGPVEECAGDGDKSLGLSLMPPAEQAVRQGAEPSGSGCGGSSSSSRTEPQPLPALPLPAPMLERSSGTVTVAAPQAAGHQSQPSAPAGSSVLRPHKPYRSYLRGRTKHYFKIPWAELEDITPGFEERLAALCAARGRVLTGVYVRAGCIELTIHLAEYGAGTTRAGVHAGPAAAAGALSHSDAAVLSVEEVIAALGLSLPSGPADAALQAVSVQQELVDRAASEPEASGDGARSQARVVRVSPRVLLLTPADAAASSAAALRVRVAFGGSTGPATAFNVAMLGAAGVLATRVTAKELQAASKEGAEAGSEEWEYAIELLEAPPHPQLLTVQLAFPAAAAGAAAEDSAAAATPSPYVQWLSVPVLAVDDAAVAAELSAALQLLQTSEAGAEVGAAAEWAHPLLCDLGLWLASAAASGAAGCSEAVRRLPAEWVSEVGACLLAYTEGAGLVATAARIRADTQRLAALPAVAEAIAAKESPRVADDDAAVGTCQHAAASTSGSATAAMAWQKPNTNALRQRCKGSSRGKCASKGAECGGKEEESSSSAGGGSDCSPDGLQQYTQAWIVAMCFTCQIVECLVALGFAVRGVRAGQPLWSAESAVVYTGLGVGVVTTLAGLWMTPRAWSRLALAARLPRFLGFMFGKALVSVGALPPPAGAATYGSGPGILLLEGVILPSGCLLPPRTALAMSCLKLPLNIMSGLVVGAFENLLPAVLMALAVEALAMGTTLACHGYVRRHYMRLRWQ
ncbi:hypothetical protein CHLRE_16g684827v5 [Chlamydomonas reinhardtii]|uniref:Uncharacterized protein n=1 Tax=Chlamydomonas reinhardtii TaxID=3055 RepID=A0A2K3CW27_CHLRE|nr:uncharacterized protein CHLRE_16g684827v5 [Chlamydomonas reinhardtii]PNW72483.1 hypothetical protein CHLRE_16g684827v5 [Chlamydomonas reinhardtii]